MRIITTVVLAFAISSSAAAAENGYYSQPALWGDTLVFVSEGDLWTTTLPESTGDQAIIAHRLTSGEGDESRPQISPDGKWLAFSAQYEGNTDAYVMPIDGGPPTRLTYHPSADLVAGWSPDGQSVLLVSGAVNPFGRLELWRVGVVAGENHLEPSTMPQRYNIGECSMVSMSSTGRRFAFTRWSNENWTWKHYRGGTAPDIWVGQTDSGEFKPLTADRANDLFPMWIGGRVYFISDRAGVANIFSVSPDTGEGDLKQHTKFAADAKNPAAIEGYDARWPAMDMRKGAAGGRIAFCQAGQLALLNLQNDAVQRLNVQIASDRVLARRRYAPVCETLTEFALSPDGKKLVLGSRGEILAADVDTGAITQLTRDAGSREWGAAFVDDQRLALVTDLGGEQQIATLPIDGSDTLRSVTRDREAWLFPPVASPDGRWLAFADKTLRLHVLELATMQITHIDQGEAGEITDYRFSPDSNWLAYAKQLPNGMSNVMIANVGTGRSFPVSDALSSDDSPRWDPMGKYLYMLSNRSINPVLSEFDTEYALINTVKVIAVSLATETPPPSKELLLAAKFDIEDWTTAEESPKKDDAKPGKATDQPKPEADENDDDGDGDDAKKQPAAIRLDTEGLALRQFILPIPAGNYDNLEAVAGAVLFVANPVEGLLDDTWPQPPQPKGTLKRYDIIDAKSKDIAKPVSEFSLSRDGSSLAYAEMDDEGEVSAIRVIPATGAEGGDDDGGHKQDGVDLADAQLRVEIPAEWKQIIGEAWRLQRDFFWAPNMAGLDWPAMRAKYEALLPRVGSRAELNDVLGQMIGELGNSHSYIFGGQPARETKSVGVGLLGCDVVTDARGHRIVNILPSQNWPGSYTSPLADPALGVRPGAFIRAVNGVDASTHINIYDLLQDQAGKMVRLIISDDGSEKTRTIEVKAIANEQPLRYAAWVESNRRYVELKSGGKLGYLHIPDMGGQGLMMFSRYFYPQFDKPGLVIDVRDNGGGFVSQMILERLNRKVLAFDQPRTGVAERYPQRAVNAHMATIIDQHAGSDGDIFPSMFRKMGLGPLIGMRTWGGVVGIRGDKAFVDMGLSTQPEFAWWEKEGGWVIENVGVEPDIEIDDTPTDRSMNRDPQLDRTIEYLLKKLEESPIEQPPLPAWPLRTGK